MRWLPVFRSPPGSILQTVLEIHQFVGFRPLCSSRRASPSPGPQLAIAAQDTLNHLKGTHYFPAERSLRKNRECKAVPGDKLSVAHFSFSGLVSYFAPVTWSSPASSSLLPSVVVNTKVCPHINYCVSWDGVGGVFFTWLPNATWFSLETVPFIAP